MNLGPTKSRKSKSLVIDYNTDADMVLVDSASASSSNGNNLSKIPILSSSNSLVNDS